MRWSVILWVKLLAGHHRHRMVFPGAGRSFDPARRRNGTGTQPPAERTRLEERYLLTSGASAGWYVPTLR